jgi:hypothetical protein
MADQVFNKTGIPITGYSTLLSYQGRAAKITRREIFGRDPEEAAHMLVYDSDGWKPKPVKHWNGTTWEEKPLKRWDGANWVETLI